MLRRIALALSLLAGSPLADEITLQDTAECEDSDSGDEMALGADGTIEDWSVMRLVLPDLGSDTGCPEWLETPVRAGTAGRLTLGTLGGRAITGPDGEALGIVRGALVSSSAGRVLALDVDIGPALGGESRRLAMPWASLSVGGGAIRYVGDTGWIQAAPGIEAE
ncbi:MAG: PRC-barrel domain-containing protein [Planctomycetota bacterium]|nr:PRC-barrel domain-containing protein [Planctomycetota bacterium]